MFSGVINTTLSITLMTAVSAGNFSLNRLRSFWVWFSLMEPTKLLSAILAIKYFSIVSRMAIASYYLVLKMRAVAGGQTLFCLHLNAIDHKLGWAAEGDSLSESAVVNLI